MLWIITTEAFVERDRSAPRAWLCWVPSWRFCDIWRVSIILWRHRIGSDSSVHSIVHYFALGRCLFCAIIQDKRRNEYLTKFVSAKWNPGGNRKVNFLLIELPWLEQVCSSIQKHCCFFETVPYYHTRNSNEKYLPTMKPSSIDLFRNGIVYWP